MHRKAVEKESRNVTSCIHLQRVYIISHCHSKSHLSSLIGTCWCAPTIHFIYLPSNQSPTPLPLFSQQLKRPQIDKAYFCLCAITGAKQFQGTKTFAYLRSRRRSPHRYSTWTTLDMFYVLNSEPKDTPSIVQSYICTLEWTGTFP